MTGTEVGCEGANCGESSPAPEGSERQAKGLGGANFFTFRVPVQAFTLRWWVLGMRMSSRYFATVRRVTQ